MSLNSSSGSSSLRDDTRQRVLVFVAGGMTYSEMRAIYQISSKMNKDGYIGSTSVWTPEGFINALKTFGKAGNKGLVGGGAGPSNGHGGGIPSGASVLSPPSNEVSGLRSTARQAQHQQPPPSAAFDQSSYDRRFGGGATSGPTSSSARPSPHHHAHSHIGAATSHQQHQQHQQYSGNGGGNGGGDSYASSAGGGGGGYAGGAIPSHIQTYNGGSVGPSTSQGSLGRASLAGSTAGSVASGKDDKTKKKKNIFGFKKGSKE